MLLAGCATAKTPWVEQNAVHGLVLLQSVEAGSGETFTVCNAVENRGTRAAYIYDGLEHRIETSVYAVNGEIIPPERPGHSSRVPPAFPWEVSSYHELAPGASIGHCDALQYGSTDLRIFIVQSSYQSPLDRGAQIAEAIAASVANGSREPLLTRDDQALRSNRCRVDRQRRTARC
jgi:hypothetical protein